MAPKIFLNKEGYDFLNSGLRVKSEYPEFELRFGYLVDERDRKRFISSIDNVLFKKLYDYLSKNEKLKLKTEKSVVSIFPTRDRNISIRKIVYDGDEIIWQRKVKDENVDISYKDFAIRMSYADEFPLSKQEIENVSRDRPDEVRERKRYLFTPSHKAYSYVLTEVRSRRDIIYEFEIEYDVKRKDIFSRIKNVLQDSINEILPLFISSESIFSYISDDEARLVRDRLKLRLESENIRESKPVNLPRDIVHSLQRQNYTVTNKLDGERFMLFFYNDDGVYAVNNRRLEKVASLTIGDNYIFECEYFEGKFYIFDCLIYNESNITSKPLMERIQYCVDFIKKASYYKESSNQSLYRLFSNLVVKEFGTNLYEDTKRLLETLPIDKNDGLIYTMNGPYNSPIYKWKFPEKMTIDFLPFFEGVREGKYAYSLYVGGKRDPIFFSGTRDCPLAKEENIFYTIEKLETTGKEGRFIDMIYEFGYDIKTQTFILFRPRVDKIKPNYIDTALSVWNDICVPFTSDQLLDLFIKLGSDFTGYHNKAKRNLISEYCHEKNVLDLGVGRGGDFKKYEKTGINYLWGVEPCEKNYQEFERRLIKMKDDFRKKVTLIKTVAQDTSEITSSINDTIISTYIPSEYSRDEISKNWTDWFPSLDKNGMRIDKKSFMMTKEGEYSITKKYDTELINKAMYDTFGYFYDLRITDGTGNMGGDTINFAFLFDYVNTVEINKETFNVLENNVGLYNFDNVSLYNDDITKIWPQLADYTDVLYLDPPWGGEKYKSVEDIELYLGDMTLKDFLDKTVLSFTSSISGTIVCPQHIVIKAPLNYDPSKLSGMNRVRCISVYNIRGSFQIIILSTLKCNKKVDIISSFFSLSFFFFKDGDGKYTDLDNLVNTIKDNLKPGGYFIGTTIDGESTIKLLDEAKDNKFYFEGGTIGYKSVDQIEKWDRPIEIILEGTIVETQTESLVNFGLLTQKLREYDIVLEKTSFLDAYYDTDDEFVKKLTERELNLSSIYRTFVFKRFDNLKSLEFSIEKTLNCFEPFDEMENIKGRDRYSDQTRIFDLSTSINKFFHRFSCVDSDKVDIFKPDCNYLFKELCTFPKLIVDGELFSFTFNYSDENKRIKSLQLDGKMAIDKPYIGSSVKVLYKYPKKELKNVDNDDTFLFKLWPISGKNNYMLTAYIGGKVMKNQCYNFIPFYGTKEYMLNTSLQYKSDVPLVEQGVYEFRIDNSVYEVDIDEKTGNTFIKSVISVDLSLLRYRPELSAGTYIDTLNKKWKDFFSNKEIYPHSTEKTEREMRKLDKSLEKYNEDTENLYNYYMLLREFYYGYKYFNRLEELVPNFIQTYGIGTIPTYERDFDVNMEIWERIKEKDKDQKIKKIPVIVKKDKLLIFKSSTFSDNPENRTPEIIQIKDFVNFDTLQHRDNNYVYFIIKGLFQQLYYCINLMELYGIDISRPSFYIVKDESVREIKYPLNNEGAVETVSVYGFLLKIADYSTAFSKKDKEYDNYSWYNYQKGLYEDNSDIVYTSEGLKDAMINRNENISNFMILVARIFGENILNFYIEKSSEDIIPPTFYRSYIDIHYPSQNKRKFYTNVYFTSLSDLKKEISKMVGHDNFKIYDSDRSRNEDEQIIEIRESDLYKGRLNEFDVFVEDDEDDEDE